MQKRERKSIFEDFFPLSTQKVIQTAAHLNIWAPLLYWCYFWHHKAATHHRRAWKINGVSTLCLTFWTNNYFITNACALSNIQSPVNPSFHSMHNEMRLICIFQKVFIEIHLSSAVNSIFMRTNPLNSIVKDSFLELLDVTGFCQWNVHSCHDISVY